MKLDWFQPRRTLAFAPVFGGLALACLVLHSLMELSVGPRPVWLEDDVPVDWSYYQSYGQQVAGTQWQLERETKPFPQRWGILLGASTIQRGPLPRLLQEATDMGWLLLGIGGGTGAFDKLSRSQPTLAASGLRPDHVVLGVHPFWLSTPPRSQGPPASTGLWFIRNRKLVSNALHGRFQELRERLFFDLGGTFAVFRPAQRPWDPEPEQPETRQLAPRKLEHHRSLNQKAGRFEAANYRPDSAPVQGLRRYLREVQHLQPQVTLFLLPEHSKFRVRVPEEATRVLEAAVAETSPPGSSAIVDLRAALPDDLFFDNYHLTMDGRAQLSLLMGEHLKR